MVNQKPLLSDTRLREEVGSPKSLRSSNIIAHGCPQHLVEIGNALSRFNNPGHSKRSHSLPERLLLEVGGASSFDDELSDWICDADHFQNSATAGVTFVFTFVTPAALVISKGCFFDRI